jgi:hypothetical protein
LQKRVVGVKVESVENVEKGFKRIGIVAVRKTHEYLRCDDGFKARGSPIACGVCYESEVGLHRTDTRSPIGITDQRNGVYDAAR